MEIVRDYDDNMKKIVYSSTSELCAEFKQNNPGFGTNPIKLGIKIKKYRIDGLEIKRTKKGTNLTFNIEKCMDLFIRQGHIRIDDLPNTIECIEPIETNEVHQVEERLSDMIRNPNTELMYKV